MRLFCGADFFYMELLAAISLVVCSTLSKKLSWLPEAAAAPPDFLMEPLRELTGTAFWAAEFMVRRVDP